MRKLTDSTAQGADAVSTYLLPLDSNVCRNPLGVVYVHEAVNHPTLQLAMCANAAQSLDSFQRVPKPSIRTLRFVTDTVNSLNEALASDGAAEDAIIAAVSSLIGNCVCPFGNVSMSSFAKVTLVGSGQYQSNSHALDGSAKTR